MSSLLLQLVFWITTQILDILISNVNNHPKLQLDNQDQLRKPSDNSSMSLFRFLFFPSVHDTDEREAAEAPPS